MTRRMMRRMAYHGIGDGRRGVSVRMADETWDASEMRQWLEAPRLQRGVKMP